VIAFPGKEPGVAVSTQPGNSLEWSENDARAVDISHEASSIASHQQLGNLTLLYDDNSISIEDDTAIAKSEDVCAKYSEDVCAGYSEDVCARYEAYGWHVQRVSWRTPDGYHEDVAALHAAFIATREHAQALSALHAAFIAAREHAQAPSLISLRSIIGWPAPTRRCRSSSASRRSGWPRPPAQAWPGSVRLQPAK